MQATTLSASHVKQGQQIARIYDLKRTGGAPVSYYAERDGLLAARRHPALVSMRDTLAVIAEVV